MITLYDRNILKLHELDPNAWWAVECWMNDSFALGRAFTVSESFRTVERQQWLYAQGRTRPGDKVTERDGVNVVSDHQLRLAVDIYPNCPQKKQAEWWRDIADIGKNYGIEHPYTKGRFIDLPHFTVGNAKPKPTPRPPASVNEAIRMLERELKKTKPGLAYERKKSRLELLYRIKNER
jgi:hypothetical protein